MQRPVSNQTLTVSTLNNLSIKDQQYMQKMAAERFDKIMVNLKSMPRTMLLAIR